MNVINHIFQLYKKFGRNSLVIAYARRRNEPPRQTTANTLMAEGLSKLTWRSTPALLVNSGYALRGTIDCTIWKTFMRSNQLLNKDKIE